MIPKFIQNPMVLRALHFSAVSLLTYLMLVPRRVAAQIYSGGGIEAGVSAAEDISGVSSSDPRDVIINLTKEVVSYMGLAAVVVIVIAGIYLVVSAGDEDAKERAKKIILYTLAGLLLILFSAGLVGIFVLAGQNV